MRKDAQPDKLTFNRVLGIYKIMCTCACLRVCVHVWLRVWLRALRERRSLDSFEPLPPISGRADCREKMYKRTDEANFIVYT